MAIKSTLKHYIGQKLFSVYQKLKSGSNIATESVINIKLMVFLTLRVIKSFWLLREYSGKEC